MNLHVFLHLQGVSQSGGGSELYSEGAQLRSSSAVLRTPNRVIINIPGTPTQ